MEILIATLLVMAAIFILYRSAKRKAQGKCECGSCSSHCPMYENKENQPK